MDVLKIKDLIIKHKRKEIVCSKALDEHPDNLVAHAARNSEREIIEDLTALLEGKTFYVVDTVKVLIVTGEDGCPKKIHSIEEAEEEALTNGGIVIAL